MTFLRRYHLWPVFQSGMDFTTRMGRLRWILWRWWTWDLRRRYRQAHCRGHEPVSVRVGQMRDFTEGNPVTQRIICAHCGVTIKEFAPR